MKKDKITTKTQNNFPAKEMQEIQEALKTLGYIVYGYKKKHRPERIIVHLEYDYPFVSLSTSSDKHN